MESKWRQKIKNKDEAERTFFISNLAQINHHLSGREANKVLILRGTKTPGDKSTETPIVRHKGAVAQTFLAVEDRSIGDIVSHDYNDYDDYNNYNDYIDYTDYNDYSDYNNYND